MPKDNRSVGSPASSDARMQARDVPVAHNPPRINDQRKVRPHGVETPPMGIRPKHPGAEIAPVAPPDRLGGSYIGARDVPMATMTEAELAEWNPISAARDAMAPMFHSKRPEFFPGDAIAYQQTSGKIIIHLVHDGKIVASK